MPDKLAAVVPRIAQLTRMLASSSDGEVLAAARALVRTLVGAGLDIHAVVERIEIPPVSDEEMQKIFDAGYAERVSDEAEQRHRAVAVVASLADGEVGDGINGYSWREIAGHCLANRQRIRSRWESDRFIPSVAERLANPHYKLSDKEAPILRRIFQTWFSGKI